MKYISENGIFDFKEYFAITFVNDDDLPSFRFDKKNVIGKNGSVIFVDGLENKQLTAELTSHVGDITARRNIAREMKRIISKPGYLIPSFENDISYKAQVLEGINTDFNSTYDKMNLIFELSPVGYSRITENIAWEDLDISWNLINQPWESIGTGFTFELTGPEDITVVNYGNYKAKSIIKVTTNNNITIGPFTLVHRVLIMWIVII